MQIGPLLIRRPRERFSRERAWRDERTSRRGEPRRINSRIATGCASTKEKRGEILERRGRGREMEGSGKLGGIVRDRITSYDKRGFTRFLFRPQRKQDRIVWTMIRYGARERGGRSGIVP